MDEHYLKVSHRDGRTDVVTREVYDTKLRDEGWVVDGDGEKPKPPPPKAKPDSDGD